MRHLDAHIFSVTETVSGHLAHQRKPDWHGLECKALLAFLSVMLIGLNVISGNCISKLIGRISLPFYIVISFLCLCFYFSWKHVTFTWLTPAKKCSAAKCDENIIVEGERSINAAEKNPGATIVTSIHSACAAVVGSVNATKFGQRWTRHPSFYYCSVAKWILQFHSGLLPGSQVSYYNYRFCHNHFWTQFASFSDVLYSIGTTWNKTEAVPWLSQ